MFETWDLSLENQNSIDLIKEAFAKHFEISESNVDYIIGALCALYNGREYHNVNHIAYALNKFQTVFERYKLVDNQEELCIAIMFHDCIYTGNGKSDVFSSSQIAKCISKGIGLSTNSIDRVSKLIMSTYSHIPYNNDSGILCDCDMSILGDYDVEYQNYSDSIKKEYLSIGVSEKAYKIGRATFLENILKKDIFYTEKGKELWEERAKENIHGELSRIKLDI
jgi:predicted metal-dependent HD superfamily phosphohydrolase